MNLNNNKYDINIRFPANGWIFPCKTCYQPIFNESSKPFDCKRCIIKYILHNIIYEIEQLNKLQNLSNVKKDLKILKQIKKKKSVIKQLSDKILFKKNIIHPLLN